MIQFLLFFKIINEAATSAFTLSSKENCNTANTTVSKNSSSWASSNQAKVNFDKVSQEERDAAHNLVSLHMQSRTIRSRSNSSNSVSTMLNSQSTSHDTEDTHVSYESRDINKSYKSSWSERRPSFFQHEHKDEIPPIANFPPMYAIIGRW